MSRYLLVDCNNFFVSCERLFNPGLEKRPVIVLSNNDGCVIARSQEAKQLGIKMGEPFFQIRDLCKNYNVASYSSNFELYGDLSQRVMNILAQRNSEIEIYSIDEAFLSYSDAISSEKITDEAREIRRLVKQWVGIPVSIGIAPTKTLAKAANYLAKKDRTQGIFDLSDPQIQKTVLQSFPIQEIWGIGSRFNRRLNEKGIYTAWQFREMDPIIIRQQMGVTGERMLWELRGLSCLSLEEPEAKKSITCSRSFGSIVTEQSDLAEALSTHINNACLKLRQQNSCAKALCVYLEARVDGDSKKREPYSLIVPLEFATDDTVVMIKTAKQCLTRLYQNGKNYKKCGVILLDLIEKSHIVPDFFTPREDPKRSHFFQTVDAVNQRFGKNTLFYGAMGIERKWQARSESRTPRYTTCWNELLKVKSN